MKGLVLISLIALSLFASIVSCQQDFVFTFGDRAFRLVFLQFFPIWKRANLNLLFKTQCQQYKKKYEDEEKRIAEKIGVIIDEEEERKRRIEQDRNYDYRQRKVELFNIDQD